MIWPWRRRRREAELDEEIAGHLAMAARDHEARGESAEEARFAARREFGNGTLVKEITRSMWGGAWLRQAIRDLTLALRALRRAPQFSLSVVLVLGMGIGATTAMFSAVDAAFLRPLPFAHPEQLVTLRGIGIPFAPAGQVLPSSQPDLPSVSALSGTFSSVAVYASGGLNLDGDGSPERVSVATVTPGFFATLGVRPERGRTFAATEGRPGYARVAILSHGLWRRRFGGQEVVGTAIRLNGRSYVVVGVMPRGFEFPERADLWIPLTVPLTFASFEAFRGYLPSQVIARLADGSSLRQARAQLEVMWARVPAEVRSNLGDAVADPVAPLQLTLVGSRRAALLALLGATALLLLIACGNATNLLLTRAASRGREIAVRTALGASAGQLARLLLSESLLLSVGGALGGLGLASASLSLIRTLMPAALNGVATPALDWRVFVFAVVLAGGTGLGFGLLPALDAAHRDAAAALKAGGGWGATTRGGRLRRALVVGELALALTLLTGASLMLRSFRGLLQTDPGFRSEHVGTLELTFPARTPRAAELGTLDGVLERLRLTPGVLASGVINDLPLRGAGGISIGVLPEGRPAPSDGGWRGARYLQASAGYFRAMGIPLLEGRLMTPRDDSLAPPVVVINATMARQLWPGEDPLGRRLTQPAGLPGRTVVGVVSDVRELRLDEEPMAQMYLPIHEVPPQNVAVVARGMLPPGDLLAALRVAVQGADSTQAVYDVRMMDGVLAGSLASRRANTTLITVFAALALLLALAGAYAVVAYSVARRGRELAIRAALGATRGSLLRMVAAESASFALIGIGLGIPAAFAFSRTLTSLLYGIKPTDPGTYLIVAFLLLVAVLAASAVAARRAARLDAAEVMRAE